MVWLESQTGPIEFMMRDRVPELDRATLRIIFCLLIGGLGAKTALVPRHGWLAAAR